MAKRNRQRCIDSNHFGMHSGLASLHHIEDMAFAKGLQRKVDETEGIEILHEAVSAFCEDDWTKNKEQMTFVSGQLCYNKHGQQYGYNLPQVIFTRERLSSKWLGMFHQGNILINLNTGGDTVETLLHEIAHYLTVRVSWKNHEHLPDHGMYFKWVLKTLIAAID